MIKSLILVSFFWFKISASSTKHFEFLHSNCLFNSELHLFWLTIYLLIPTLFEIKLHWDLYLLNYNTQSFSYKFTFPSVVKHQVLFYNHSEIFASKSFEPSSSYLSLSNRNAKYKTGTWFYKDSVHEHEQNIYSY